MIFVIALLDICLSISIGSGNHFMDENGTTLIFHGFNVVYK
jgi:hypothetical protein